jgi:hypothetical protein
MITFYACPGQLELWHESPDNGGHPMWQNGEPPRVLSRLGSVDLRLAGPAFARGSTKVPIGNLPNVVSTARASPSSDGPAGCLGAGDDVERRRHKRTYQPGDVTIAQTKLSQTTAEEGVEAVEGDDDCWAAALNRSGPGSPSRAIAVLGWQSEQSQ